MSMVSYGYFKKFPKIIEAGPYSDIQISDRLKLNLIDQSSAWKPLLALKALRLRNGRESLDYTS